MFKDRFEKSHRDLGLESHDPPVVVGGEVTGGAVTGGEVTRGAVTVGDVTGEPLPEILPPDELPPEKLPPDEPPDETLLDDDPPDVDPPLVAPFPGTVVPGTVVVVLGTTELPGTMVVAGGVVAAAFPWYSWPTKAVSPTAAPRHAMVETRVMVLIRCSPMSRVCPGKFQAMGVLLSMSLFSMTERNKEPKNKS